MNLAARVWPVAATFVLGLAGLFVPGPAGDVAAFVWLGVFPGLALTRLLLPGAPAATRWTLGMALAPLAWLAGVPWSEASDAGALLGTKTVLNELVAYIDLAKGGLSERSRVLMTYALCGFANFGSLGIMIGGLGTMCPERRAEVVSLGMKSIVAGTLATCFTAASVALIL